MSPSQALNTLNQLLKPDTFRQFVIRTEDRREFEVVMPSRVALPAYPDEGHFAFYEGNQLHIIGLDSIVSIEVAR